MQSQVEHEQRVERRLRDKEEREEQERTAHRQIRIENVSITLRCYRAAINSSLCSGTSKSGLICPCECLLNHQKDWVMLCMFGLGYLMEGEHLGVSMELNKWRLGVGMLNESYGRMYICVHTVEGAVCLCWVP